MRTGGRAKGQPNKLTAEAREVFQAVLDKQAPKVDQWFERVSKTNPAKAIELLLHLSERFIPKLSRHEVSGLNGEPIQLSVEINRYVAGENKEKETELAEQITSTTPIDDGSSARP